MQEPWNCPQKKRTGNRQSPRVAAFSQTKAPLPIFGQGLEKVFPEVKGLDLDFKIYFIICNLLRRWSCGKPIFWCVWEGENCVWACFDAQCLLCGFEGQRNPIARTIALPTSPPPPSICRSTRPRNGDRPKCQQFHLNRYIWIHLNTSEYIWIHLNTSEYIWVHLNLIQIHLSFDTNPNVGIIILSTRPPPSPHMPLNTAEKWGQTQMSTIQFWV